MSDIRIYRKISDRAFGIAGFQHDAGNVALTASHEVGDATVKLLPEEMPALAAFALDCLTAEQRAALLERYCTPAEPAEGTR